jgi:hypothetical protein
MKRYVLPKSVQRTGYDSMLDEAFLVRIRCKCGQADNVKPKAFCISLEARMWKQRLMLIESGAVFGAAR